MTTSRLLSDYGMLLVLAALCVFFSVVTLSDQPVTGNAAVRQVVSGVLATGSSPRALIAVGSRPGDSAFAKSLQSELTAAGARVLEVAEGEPKTAREALVRIVTGGEQLDAIACTQPAASWLLFADLSQDFPKLGSPRVIAPRSVRWPNFLKSENLLNIANQIAVIAIMAIGMTMVIVAGGIDLSVGSLLALSAVLATRFIRDYGGGESASAPAMIACCLSSILIVGAVGALTGWLTTRFSIPPFIVTLAVMLVGSGLAYTLSAGQSIYQLPASFVWLGRGADLFGLPNAVVLMLVLYPAAALVMSRTVFGRHVYCVGGNRQAAWLSGVNVRRVISATYIVSALLAGLGGVVMASQLRSGSATFGAMYELYVIAAVVVGGTSLSGGEGRMLGTLIGAFIIAVIQNGMNLTNVESYTQKVVLGLVILGAVLADQSRRNRTARHTT